MNNQDKIDRIDEVLAQCEDILHGRAGEEVTEARKLLSQLATNDGSANVSEIKSRAKKELLNAYYVAIFERDMSVEDIMQSIEADRQFLDGEMVLGEAKSILNGR